MLVFPRPNEGYSQFNCFNRLEVIVDQTGVLFLGHPVFVK